MAYKTIILKGDGVSEEALADGANTPGMLLERTTAGLFKVHSSAGQPAEALFSVEDELQGNEIDDAYADAARVLARSFRKGDQVYAFLNNGETAAIGNYLESAGNGRLRVYAADSAGAVEYPASIVGQALLAVDMSGSSGADPSGRIPIVII